MNTKLLISLIFIFIIYIMGDFVSAQDAVDEIKLYELQDTIVVVADRFKLPLKELTYTYEVIPGYQIEEISRHSALELVDIVFPSAYTLDKKVIGYGVGREGAGTINIRGQGGKPNTGMLVLINGHPDFMSIFGHPLPDVYGMDDVRQVEILAGPTSSVFGSNAMGGVINIKTGPDYTNLAKISFEGGSYKTYNLGLNIAKKYNNHGLFLTARHKHTDGHIAQSSFESYHFQGGWQYHINPEWQISLQGRYVPYKFDDYVRERDPANLGTYAKIRRGTGEIILENIGKSLQGSTQIYGNWGNHRFYDGFESRDFTYGVSSYQQWRLAEELNLAVGGDLIHYGGEAENLLARPGTVNDNMHKLTTTGIYGLFMYNVVNSLNIKLGLRYQYNSLPLEKVAPVAGFSYNILPTLKFYANYQSGFRFPTLNELYLFPSSNDDLEEESINSLESGIWFYWSNDNTLRITAFRNNVENIIQSLEYLSPPPLFKYVNSGEAIQMGVEAQVNYRVMQDFNLQLSYSYLDPDHLTAYNPKHQIKYLLTFKKGRFHSTLYGKYINKLFTDNYAIQESRLPDYNLVNLILSYNFTELDVYLRLLNLLDRKYFVGSQPDYPAPGFHFMAGVRYHLE